MNLRSSTPFWLLRTPQLETYHSLNANIKGDVVIVGGGISGALAAFELIKAGYEVTIISQSHIGLGSTVASTSLLQYEIDTPLNELVEKIGKETANRSYLLCHQSINELENIHIEVGLKGLFQKRKSLFLASRRKDVEGLEKEYEARAKIGIDLKFLTEEEISSNFNFRSPAALYSEQGAQTDAYLLTQKLIQWSHLNGAKVFDKTEIKAMHHQARGVELTTASDFRIKAKYVVMATGYDSVNWLDLNLARLHSTYVITSEPFKKSDLWKDECLIWETARPYIYLRTTKDNRIIVGGKDEMFVSAKKRDTLLTKKVKELLKAFNLKFPHLQFNVDYAWTGTFAETADGLPFIGAPPKMPRVFFALGFGGNGITFSQIAAVIIRDLISNRVNPDKHRFGFNRKIKKGV